FLARPDYGLAMRGPALLCTVWLIGVIGCATARPGGATAEQPSLELGTPDDAEKGYRADYEAAVARATRDDLAGAYDLLARRGALLEGAGHHDLAALVWNTTTWVRWAAGDLDGAL